MSHLSVCPGHNPDAESLPRRLVPEERISFGINPSVSTLTTVVQIREDYNEVDCRLIAKEVKRVHIEPVCLLFLYSVAIIVSNCRWE